MPTPAEPTPAALIRCFERMFAIPADGAAGLRGSLYGFAARFTRHFGDGHADAVAGISPLPPAG